jgi:hypothetical protein
MLEGRLLRAPPPPPGGSGGSAGCRPFVIPRKRDARAFNRTHIESKGRLGAAAPCERRLLRAKGACLPLRPPLSVCRGSPAGPRRRSIPKTRPDAVSLACWLDRVVGVRVVNRRQVQLADDSKAPSFVSEVEDRADRRIGWQVPPDRVGIACPEVELGHRAPRLRAVRGQKPREMAMRMRGLEPPRGP